MICLQTRPIIRSYLLLFELPHFYLYISLCIANAKRKHCVVVAVVVVELGTAAMPRNRYAVFCLLSYSLHYLPFCLSMLKARSVEISNYLANRIVIIIATPLFCAPAKYLFSTTTVCLLETQIPLPSINCLVYQISSEGTISYGFKWWQRLRNRKKSHGIKSGENGG